MCAYIYIYTHMCTYTRIHKTRYKYDYSKIPVIAGK